MMRQSVLALVLSLSAVTTMAWVSPSVGLSRAAVPRMARSSKTSTSLRMAIDYKDPVVAEEFALVQPMDIDDVEAELQSKGIPVPPTMNEMDIKLMLVEIRLRFSGKIGGQKVKQRPAKFASKFEELMWTKPMFKEFYETLKAKGDHNAQNVVAEYVNDKKLAIQRYGKDYKALIRQTEAALTAAIPVNSPTLKFSGFPANMGEDACKMTLGAVGTIVDFECQQDEDFPVLNGKVTFEDLEDAKKAVAQYNGMDMGMGTKLELVSM
jgi:uncharacterized protein CbrC (UPF0167 family)